MNEPVGGEPKDVETSKSYRLWHIGTDNEFIAVVAEADSFDEMRKVRRRAD